MRSKLTVLAALCGGLFTAPLLGQPAITIQPTNAITSLNGYAQFRVSAAPSAGSISYQWWFKDATLDAALNPSATKSILRLTNVTAAMAGDYWVVVTDDNGSTTSDKARLTVDTTFVKVTGPGFLKNGADGPIPTFVDFDHDGWLEVVNSRGYWTDPKLPMEVYENGQDGTFTRITNGLARLPGRWVVQSWADFDGNGLLDCFSVQHQAMGEPSLFLNRGGGEFSPVPINKYTTANGLALSASIGFCADYDGDGWVDLALSAFAGLGGLEHNRLLRNLGDARFEVNTNTPVAIRRTNVETFTWVDYDSDGDLDLHAATSGYEVDQLFQNQGDGTFVRIRSHPLVDRTGQNIVPGWADYDNDGDWDLFVPDWQAPGGSMYRNRGNGEFDELLDAVKLDSKSVPTSGQWGDYDNDGDVDLFVTQDRGSNRLFANDGNGTFTEVTVGNPTGEITTESFVGYWADYDNDGFLDLLVILDGRSTTQPHGLYRNNLPNAGNSNHWLKIQLKGKVSNSTGIGAIVRVKATIGGKSVWQTRQIGGPIDQTFIAHFGLGDATKAELIRIEWPSGNVQELTDYDANNLYTFTEPNRIQPLRPSASPGGAVVLTASVAASYQWRFNGVDLPMETKRTLSLTNITTAMAGRYSAVVTAADASVTTNFTYLTVDPMFTKITEGEIVTDEGASFDSSWGDYDGDGYADLFVPRHTRGTSAVYRNERNGTFARVGGLPFGQQAIEYGIWNDLDNDGLKDLLHVQWVNTVNQMTAFFRKSDGSYQSKPIGTLPTWWDRSLVDYDRDGHLDVYFALVNSSALFRNNGDGSFARVTQEQVGPIVGAVIWGGANWADVNDDGWPELWAPSYQSSRTYMYRRTASGQYMAMTNLMTQTTAPVISSAWADYDNDGVLDVCAVCINGATTFYRGLGNGEFERATDAPSVTGSHNSAAWGDYDNDGFLDLFLSGGVGKNKLFHNAGNGSFFQTTTGSIANDRPINGAGTYSALWFDYDNDGFLDLFASNGDEAASLSTRNFLYRNAGNPNGWLTLRLVGTASNRDGIGAKVRVLAKYAGKERWQRRDTSAGDVYNGNHLYAHFGLGDATKADTVRIEWPSGIVQELSDVSAKQILTVTEPTELVALGEGRIWVRCWKGMKYEVEVSNDLSAWTSLGVFTNETGRLELTDAGAAGQPYRFYRAIAR